MLLKLYVERYASWISYIKSGYTRMGHLPACYYFTSLFVENVIMLDGFGNCDSAHDYQPHRVEDGGSWGLLTIADELIKISNQLTTLLITVLS